MAEGGGATVYVFGRISADFTPLQPMTPLEDVARFERSVGGFAGNVTTGLARLGTPTAIVSAVGDDGFGRYARGFLQKEGVDIDSLLVHPTLRTALAFYELWPPDTFPVTLYRLPTCPDWEIRPQDVPIEKIARAPVFVTSGTALARRPSRETALRILTLRRQLQREGRLTLFDLDWRDQVWSAPREFARWVRRVLPHTDILVGGLDEFEKADLSPAETIRAGPSAAVVKRGPRGATLFTAHGSKDVAGRRTRVVNGLGAGDAFLAALVAALRRGDDMEIAMVQANVSGAIVAGRQACSVAMPTEGEIREAMAEGIR